MPAFKNPIAVAVLVALSGLAKAADVPAKVPGFDPTAIDRSMPACTDFYKFACGNWIVRLSLWLLFPTCGTLRYPVATLDVGEMMSLAPGDVPTRSP